MKPKASRSKTILTKLVAVVILALLVVAAVKCTNGASLANTAWSLLPPVIAIVLALITKEAYSALFIGVLVGSLFTCGFAPVATLDTILNDGLIAAISANAGIFLFLVLLGIIVALVNAAGGSAAFGRWAETHIKTHAGAQLATFVLGILIFIDDYFNCLTVGSVMRPVTDSHKISRPKLAYLIDATAAPVCMIAPISSWAAAVSSTAEGLDTGMSGIELFVKAIPYNLYSILTFVFILAIIAMKLDYGPMRKFEAKAAKGDLSALVEEAGESANPNGRVIDLILPVLALIVTCTIGMIYVGGFFGADMSGDPSFAGDFIGAFGNTNAFVGLPWGGIIALVLTVIYLAASAIIALGYSIFYFEVQLPNGSAAQLLDIMDYVSNSVMMPFIALLSAFLIGWIKTPDYVIEEMESTGDTFRRKKLYRVMIRYVVPVMMFVLFLQSTGIL